VAERKILSKKTRFEVFKRDKFTCQYCGRMAPDVILEVDHIKPVAKGGDNDILNLITSCRDCNRGKGKNLLSQSDVLKKSQKQLLDMAEKAEQEQMMVDWKKELLSVREREAKAIGDLIISLTGVEEVDDYHLQEIRKMLVRFPFHIVWEATEIASIKYFNSDFVGTDYELPEMTDMIQKIGGICYNKQRQKGR
jgi:hypothetical protein